MKSSIKIDFADSGNGLQPIIKVKIIESDDPRDGLLQAFFEKLGGQSSWLEIAYMDNTWDGKQIWISPIPPEKLDNLSMRLNMRIMSQEGISSLDTINHNTA